MTRTTKRLTVVAAVLALAGAAIVELGMSGAGAAGSHSQQVSAREAGTIDPANFSNPQPNPYYPLTPGLVTKYRGTDDGRHYRERVTITHQHKVIEGVRARVSRDVLRRADGTIAEKTFDWYANDNTGNVWYLGEDTATYDRSGRLKSRAGSWQAGVDGAVAGLIMPADPRPTDAYRQEYRKGSAEDQAWVVQRHDKVRVPYGTVRDVVRTYEWSRLEPGVVSVKLYGPHLGIVKERDVAGGTEKFWLVSVTRP